MEETINMDSYSIRRTLETLAPLVARKHRQIIEQATDSVVLKRKELHEVSAELMRLENELQHRRDVELEDWDVFMGVALGMALTQPRRATWYERQDAVDAMRRRHRFGR